MIKKIQNLIPCSFFCLKLFINANIFILILNNWNISGRKCTWKFVSFFLNILSLTVNWWRRKYVFPLIFSEFYSALFLGSLIFGSSSTAISQRLSLRVIWVLMIRTISRRLCVTTDVSNQFSKFLIGISKSLIGSCEMNEKFHEFQWKKGK